MDRIVIEISLILIFTAGLIALLLVKWRYESFKNIDLTAETVNKYHEKLVYFADEVELPYIPDRYTSLTQNIASIIAGMIGIVCVGYAIFYIFDNSLRGFIEMLKDLLSYSTKHYSHKHSSFGGSRQVVYFMILYGFTSFYGLIFLSGMVIRLLFRKYTIVPDVWSTLWKSD